MATFQYQVRRGDSPLTIASQHNLTPQELIQANQGNYPFVTGATINIPSRGRPQPQPTGPNIWQQIFSSIGQQQKTGGSPFAPIGGDPIQNALKSVGLDFNNAFKGWNTGQNPNINANGGSGSVPYGPPAPQQTFQFPTGMPRNSFEQRDFLQGQGTQAIGGAGSSDYVDAANRVHGNLGGADFFKLFQQGTVPQTVEPWLASYVNQKLGDQNLPALYDEAGNYIGGQASQGGASDVQYGPIKGADRWQNYQNKQGFNVARNPNGTLILNRSQYHNRWARAHQGQKTAPMRTSVGLVSFRVGNG